MNNFRRSSCLSSLLCVLLTSLAPAASSAEAPPMTLAMAHRNQSPVKDFWVSEKLDGVRAYWDGGRLISRQGREFAAPAWFLAGLPARPLDGELWMGRGSFEALSAAVRRQTPNDAEWRQIRYMIFDLPKAPGDFSARLDDLNKLAESTATPWLQVIPQFRVASRQELQTRYQETLAGGGEGLMLHRAASFWRAGRSDDLQKLKPFDDAEATVIGHLPGKGKYVGLTGALLLETPEGRRFAVGSGLTEDLRRAPPAIGSLITYRHSGLTGTGMPRHPRYYRPATPI